MRLKNKHSHADAAGAVRSCGTMVARNLMRVAHASVVVDLSCAGWRMVSGVLKHNATATVTSVPARMRHGNSMMGSHAGLA